ncbi:hypothetical protein BDP27DRAFT_1429557 [Rhodocollybia butyracea]|uniref:Uncharacterized protein n=1 Tax=Rhodocollybia butyracea TaxID=206335 RepID=A0A9P5PDT3_9AGAR|nr:hypothetical protein BDP27DRAFT_1429557 [Rhodocollybia butyracea]
MLLGCPWQRYNHVSIDEQENGTYPIFKDIDWKEVYEKLIAPPQKRVEDPFAQFALDLFGPPGTPHSFFVKQKYAEISPGPECIDDEEDQLVSLNVSIIGLDTNIDNEMQEEESEPVIGTIILWKLVLNGTKSDGRAIEDNKPRLQWMPSFSSSLEAGPPGIRQCLCGPADYGPPPSNSNETLCILKDKCCIVQEAEELELGSAARLIMFVAPYFVKSFPVCLNNNEQTMVQRVVILGGSFVTLGPKDTEPEAMEGHMVADIFPNNPYFEQTPKLQVPAVNPDMFLKNALVALNRAQEQQLKRQDLFAVPKETSATHDDSCNSNSSSDSGEAPARVEQHDKVVWQMVETWQRAKDTEASKMESPDLGVCTDPDPKTQTKEAGDCVQPDDSAIQVHYTQKTTRANLKQEAGRNGRLTVVRWHKGEHKGREAYRLMKKKKGNIYQSVYSPPTKVQEPLIQNFQNMQKTDSDMEISEDEPATSYAKTLPEAMDICADCAIMAQTGLDYPGHNCSPPGFVLRSTTPFSMPDLVSVSSSSSASSLSSENSFSWALSPSIHESDPFTLYHPARNFLQPCPPYNSDNKEWASRMYLKKWKMEKSPVCTQKLQQTAAPA